MNKRLWQSLYFTLLNTVAIENETYLNVSLQNNDYPILQKLQTLSTLDIILLTILIYFRDELPSGFSPELSFADFADHLINCDYTLYEINNSLLTLYDHQFIRLSIEGGKLHYQANKRILTKRNIYIPSWDIYALGLHNLCRN